jgi:hypothetical protein
MMFEKPYRGHSFRGGKKSQLEVILEDLLQALETDD